MAKIVAFEVEIGGVKETFKSFDEIKERLKQLKKEFDSTDFGDKKFEKLQRTIAQLTKVQEEARKESSRMKQEIDANNKALDGSYRQLNAQLVVLRNSYKELSEAERNSAVGRTMLRDISILDQKLKQIDSTMGLFQRNVGNYLGALNQFAANAGRTLGGTAGNIVSGIGNIAGAGALGGPAAFLALGAAAGTAIESMVELDAKISDLQANVQKTSGLSADEVKRLTDELKELNTRTSLDNLLGIGRVLGQFGVEVNKNTISAIDKLNVALADEFGDNAELITSVVGKLRNVFTEFRNDKPDEAFLKIGNAINELGASGAATAPTIADFATRLGGTLGQFNISAGNIFGISAALEELGTTAERGATGVSRTFLRITQSSDTFAKAFKITNDVVKDFTKGAFTDFTELVNKDLFQAFQLVLSQINDLNLSNTQTAATFKALGINQEGAIEALSKLAGNQDLLNSRLAVANRAVKEQTSINDEFSTVNNTLAGELAKLKNSLENAFTNTGITDGIKNMVSWINETQRSTQSAARSTEEQKIAFQALIKSALDVNTTQERRNELISEMISKYPDYFKNLKQEEVTNLKLIEILGDVNKKYNEKIGLLALSGRAEEAEQKKNKATQDEINAEIKLRQALLEYQVKLKEKGFEPTNDLQKDLTELKKLYDQGLGLDFIGLTLAVRQYRVATGEATEARAEDFKIRIQSFQAFDKEIKANKDYNEQLLEQISLFGQVAEQRRKEADALEKAGKRQEAKTKLTNLELDAKQLLNKVDVEQLKILKETADRVQHIKASAVLGGAIKGIEKIQSAIAPQQTTGTEVVSLGKTKKGTHAADPLERAEADTKAYFEQRLAAFQKFSSVYEEKQIALLSRERDRQIELEKKKANDLILQIDETNRKLTNKQTESIDKLNKAIEKADVGQRGKLLAKKAELEKTFADDNVKLTEESEKAKQAITQASNERISAINFDFDLKERERIKRQQQNNLAGLNQYFTKLGEQIQKDRNKFDVELLETRTTKLAGAGGDKELVKKINYEYEAEGLKRTERDIIQQIKLTDQKILAARSLNSVQTLLGLPPALSEEAVKSFKDYQDQLTVTLADATAKRRAFEQAKQAQADAEDEARQQQRKQTAVNEAIDISKQLADVFNSNEKQRLQEEQDEKISLLEQEYAKRLELAKGNANEEARIQAELSKKKIEIEKQYQEEQKKIAKKQAIIAGALAILQLFASPTPDFLTKLLLAGGLAIKTGIEIASIDKQKFEKGGTFKGNSHQYGGVQGVFSDGTRIEVEKDEDFFIINKRNSYLRKQLSKMNGYRGNGRRFAEGGSVFGEQLYYQSASQPGQSKVIAQISDEQMYQLAGMVARATMEGTFQGAQNGISAGERINERYNEFNKRTNR